MATTYTVTTTFAADSTAIASEVNQNFTDVLTALNAFDAANLTSGAIPLARIVGLTSSQCAAAFFKDEDNMASDSATAVSSQQAITVYITAQIAAGLLASIQFSAHATVDSGSDTMLKAHAYKAASAGFVRAFILLNNGKTFSGYIGSTSDPAGAGVLVQKESSLGASYHSISFTCAKDKYFEITTDDTTTPTILWQSIGTLAYPIDQEP